MFGILRTVTTGGARCRYPGGELHQTAGEEDATQTWQTQTIGEGLLADKPVRLLSNPNYQSSTAARGYWRI